MKRYRGIVFILIIILLFCLSYIFKWNLYYLLSNPYILISLFFLILILSLLSGFKIKLSILISILVVIGLFAFNVYLMRVDLKKGIFFSESISERKEGEKEFLSNLMLTSGDLMVKETNGENLFIFDYYSPIKLFYKFNRKKDTASFTAKDLNLFWSESPKNEWNLYINKDIKSKILIKGKVIKGDINLLEIPVKELKIKSNVLYLNMKIGRRETPIKININSTSFIGKIEIPKGFYVDVKFDSPYIILKGKNFKNIGSGRYVKEGESGRIYISVKGKGTILTIEEENNE